MHLLAVAPVAHTDAVLAAEVTAGSPAAALELFDRYTPFVRRLSFRYGRHVTFDRDDVTQEAFVSMVLAAIEVSETGEAFTRVFHNRAIDHVRAEVSRQMFQVSIPLIMVRRVYEAARSFDNDLWSARHWLATDAPPYARMTSETFNQIWLWAFGIHLEWNNTGRGHLQYSEVLTCATSESLHRSIEDRDAVARVLALLTPAEREVIERLYGLNEYEPQVSAVVGTVMGIQAESVRRIHSRAIAKLQIHAEDLR